MTATTEMMTTKQMTSYTVKVLLQSSRLASSFCRRMCGFEFPRTLFAGNGGVSHDCICERGRDLLRGEERRRGDNSSGCIDALAQSDDELNTCTLYNEVISDSMRLQQHKSNATLLSS